MNGIEVSALVQQEVGLVVACVVVAYIDKGALVRYLRGAAVLLLAEDTAGTSVGAARSDSDGGVRVDVAHFGRFIHPVFVIILDDA